MTYSYCETAAASSSSRWHIRRLTEQGKKLGGGADSLALCGKKVAWDLERGPEFYDRVRRQEFTCEKCLDAYTTGLKGQV